MSERLALLSVVLVLAAAACGGESGSDTTTTTVPSTGTTVDGGQQAGESTLDGVIDRGELVCGVSGSAVGFSETQPDGSAIGFDADYCRAVAAAVLGDAAKVRFQALPAADRFEALLAGEVDVLIRNTYWTQDRDADIGMDFTATTYYDGQQMMGDPARIAGLTTASGFEALDGASVCTNTGTAAEQNITAGAELAGVDVTLVPVETFPEAMEAFKAGTCDVVTSDGSLLFGNRAAEAAAGAVGAAGWVVFPQRPFSKKPLGPVVRQNDSRWYDVVQWTVFATFIADEYGVTSANVDELRDSNAELSRLFGGEGEVQSAMGLAPDAFYQVIKQVGSYGELFDENLTVPLGLAREGSYNEQWFKGGLIYAPPVG